MTLTSFQDLLDASRRQPQPQRLLFTFVRIELPQAATAAQHARMQAGQGGNLSPSLCVDKAPEDIASFAALVEESAATGQAWDIVFVASLSGRAGVPPSADEAVQPLHFMVNAINNGRVAEFAAFDRDGDVLQFC